MSSKENFYNIWKKNPQDSVVLDRDSLQAMLWSDEKITDIVLSALYKTFKDKTIISNDIINSNKNIDIDETIPQEEPTITMLSWVPGAWKTTYSKQVVAQNPDTVIVSNDWLRGSLSWVEEWDINEKIWNTTIDTEQWERENLETFVAPLLNQAKDTIISTLLHHGYNIILDAPHAKWFMWDDIEKKYWTKANIVHTLIIPEKLKDGIKKAESREVRPEARETIVKIGRWIQETLQAKNEEWKPKYKFDKIVVNKYENGGFEEYREDDSWLIKEYKTEEWPWKN